MLGGCSGLEEETTELIKHVDKEARNYEKPIHLVVFL